MAFSNGDSEQEFGARMSASRFRSQGPSKAVLDAAAKAPKGRRSLGVPLTDGKQPEDAKYERILLNRVFGFVVHSGLQDDEASNESLQGPITSRKTSCRRGWFRRSSAVVPLSEPDVALGRHPHSPSTRGWRPLLLLHSSLIPRLVLHAPSAVCAC